MVTERGDQIYQEVVDTRMRVAIREASRAQMEAIRASDRRATYTGGHAEYARRRNELHRRSVIPDMDLYASPSPEEISRERQRRLSQNYRTSRFSTPYGYPSGDHADDDTE